MNWMEEAAKKTVFNYCNDADGDDIVQGTRENLEKIFMKEVLCSPGDRVVVSVKGKDVTYSYGGFEPKKLGIMTRVPFEKNGRTATRTTHPDGSHSYMADTKRRHLEKGQKGEEHRGLTKSYREAIDKDFSNQLSSRKERDIKRARLVKAMKHTDKIEDKFE